MSQWASNPHREPQMDLPLLSITRHEDLDISMGPDSPVPLFCWCHNRRIDRLKLSLNIIGWVSVAAIRGTCQKCPDTDRYIFNWLKNSDTKCSGFLTLSSWCGTLVLDNHVIISFWYNFLPLYYLWRYQTLCNEYFFFISTTVYILSFYKYIILYMTFINFRLYRLPLDTYIYGLISIHKIYIFDIKTIDTKYFMHQNFMFSHKIFSILSALQFYS